MTRGGFRGRRAPGGAFGGVSTGMSLASRRATRAVASADASRSKPGVSPQRARYPRAVALGVLGTDVAPGPMSVRTARLAIGTDLELGKTLLALL